MLQGSTSITRASVRSAQRRHPTTTSCRALLSHFFTTTSQDFHHHQKQRQQRRRSAPYNTCGASTRHGTNISTITKGSGKNANNGDFNTLFNQETVQEAIRRGVISVARARKSTAASALDEEEQEDAACVEALERDGGEVEGGLRIFRLTDIGEGIMEVEILQWFVAPGDHVRQFDKLCEVQSDKANVEITSRYDGVIRKLHGTVGDMVQTGAVLVEVEEATVVPIGSSSSITEMLSSTEVSASPSSEPAPAKGHEAREQAEGGAAWTTGDGSGKTKVLAAPAVRRLCRELSLDLSRVSIVGTGSCGRVLKSDVMAYAEAKGIVAEKGGISGRVVNGSAAGLAEREEEPVESRGAQGTPRPTVEAADGPGLLPGSGQGGSLGSRIVAAGGAVEVVEEEEEEGQRQGQRRELSEEGQAGRRERRGPVVVPIRGVQRAMMETMRRALEVPHMTFCDDVGADRLSLLRSDLKEAAERRGVKLSYLPLIVKATSMALTAFPTLNASLSEDKSSLLQHQDHNIGVAMDTEKGLLVPSISMVQERSILEIAEELNTLQRLGAAGKLGEAELSGTTFTLSNIGSIGGTYASPIILHPQVCIGALGRMQRVPVFDAVHSDKVVAARVIPVSWSADHRVVDGGTLARFSNTWKAYLENPASMLADTR